MAKQLNLLGNGQIIPTSLHVEMEKSYLEYAMSVIVGRALPDVRDGLKPVHRRILYAMYELGLTPDRPYRKCARVVGDVLGKYHPHGDQSVYDALVRLVQTFSTRYPLLDGHGNFGSVDNDPPAAMRYTESRLAPIAYEGMLTEIGQATVDFTNNFDNSQQEPVVLPVQLPILLLNGCSGIAVGMATNVPPHNLGEVVDGLIALIDRPDLADEKLWKLIPAPDFPTGGKIIDNTGILEAYRTGRGSFKVRGIAKAETITLRQKKRRRERTAIIVTELPYQVNKAGWIEKVADLVNQGRIEGISDLRDESDRTGMRVVIELKKDVRPQAVLNKLYRQTALESNFGAIMLALVDNKPVQLPLKNLLQEFLEFRELTLRRQYSNELTEAQEKQHLVSGLLIALNNLDDVINILRNAPDGSSAKLQMIEQLKVTELQADSILAMPMRRLTGLEKQKLEAEHEALQKKITELETLLSDRNELLKSLKKELRSLKRKYGDSRRTRIVDNEPLPENNTEKASPKSSTKKKKPKQESIPMAKLGKNSEVVITSKRCIYWQNPEDSTPLSSIKKGEDFIVESELIDNREQFILATDSGKAYPVAVSEIAHKMESQNKETLSFLSQAALRDTKNTIGHFFLPNKENNIDLVLLTEKGIIKRLPCSQIEDIGNRGLVLLKLKEQDRLKYLTMTKEDREIAIATSGGRVLKLPVDDRQIPIMGRNAQGNQGLRLRYGERLVGCASLDKNDNLLLVTNSGYTKLISPNIIRLGKRGDIGTQAIQFASKEDYLAAMVVFKSEKTAILTSDRQRSFILDTVKLALQNKDGRGNKIVKLESGENILNLFVREN